MQTPLFGLQVGVTASLLCAKELARVDALSPNIQVMTKPSDAWTMLKMFDAMLSA